MTLATQAYENFLDFAESHGLFLNQDEVGRAVLRAMHDQIENYLAQHKHAEHHD